MNRILIAGTGSGCGKTVITLGILKCLELRGLKTAPFKCGPDYIDPMFHSRVTGRRAANLDPWFCGGELLRRVFVKYSKGADISVIEGVMGFYDGIGLEGTGSTHSVSEILGCPVVLIVNCTGASLSAAAALKGFSDFRKNNIKAVIFNNASSKTYSILKPYAEKWGIIPLGYVPRNGAFALKQRRLGLIAADEIEELEEKSLIIAELLEDTVDIGRLISISKVQDNHGIAVAYKEPAVKKLAYNEPVIAVAKDRAFSFIYGENIDFLRECGCRTEYFSPLADKELPDGTSGIVISGGYPELYAKELSENTSMLRSILRAFREKIPIAAECGGYMYLHRGLEGEDGRMYPMVGIIDGECYKDRLCAMFGYITLKKNLQAAPAAGSLNSGAPPAKIKAHEFHYWASTDKSADLTAEKPDGSRSRNYCIFTDTLYAGFPHVYLYSCPEAGYRFVKKCSEQQFRLIFSK